MIDCSGPFLFGSDGWKLVPEHFAERHGLIALGESVAAIGAGVVPTDDGVIAGDVVLSALLGVALAALWWLYFDVVALVAARRLSNAPAGRERNEVARDGVKKVVVHPGHHLATVPAAALLGGLAVYLLAHVAFRWRTVHRFSTQRLVAAVVLAALVPVAAQVPAVVALAAAAALLAGLVAYEVVRFGEQRTPGCARRSDMAARAVSRSARPARRSRGRRPGGRPRRRGRRSARSSDRRG